MNRQLAIYNPRRIGQTGSSSTLLLVGIAVLGLLVYLLLKSRQPAPALGFKNAATWDIQLNEDGIPVKVVVTRDVKPQ